MLVSKRTTARLFAVAVGTAATLGLAVAQETGHPVHEGPSVSTPVSEIKF